MPFAAERLWYRLVQVDADGATTTSDPVALQRPPAERVQLDPPAPNPASAATTARFALPGGTISGGTGSGGTASGRTDSGDAGATEARLVVFDVLGRQVEAHSIGARGEKRGAVRLTVADWPAGIYFVRLKVGPQTRTEELTVVR